VARHLELAVLDLGEHLGHGGERGQAVLAHLVLSGLEQHGARQLEHELAVADPHVQLAACDERLELAEQPLERVEAAPVRAPASSSSRR